MKVEYLFVGAFVLVIGYFIYRIVRYRGIKGALFGARVDETLGEVYGSNEGMVGVSLKVHTLGGVSATDARVGLELVARSAMSYQMTPIKLNRSEVRKLISLLENAIGKSAI